LYHKLICQIIHDFRKRVKRGFQNKYNIEGEVLRSTQYDMIFRYLVQEYAEAIMKKNRERIKEYSNKRSINLFLAFCVILLALAVTFGTGLLTSCNPTGSTGTVSPEAPPSSSPTPGCYIWDCTLQGVVYAGEINPGSELSGAEVKLLQYSNCSPTKGEHSAKTGAKGEFEFEVSIHDTDGFTFTVEEDGYQPYKLKFGGFDCVACSCNGLEIVLEPLGTGSTSP
jgi:hypothetical protein